MKDSGGITPWQPFHARGRPPHRYGNSTFVSQPLLHPELQRQTGTDLPVCSMMMPPIDCAVLLFVDQDSPHISHTVGTSIFPCEHPENSTREMCAECSASDRIATFIIFRIRVMLFHKNTRREAFVRISRSFTGHALKEWNSVPE